MTGAPSRVSQGKNEGVGRLGSHLEALEESVPWPNRILAELSSMCLQGKGLHFLADCEP